MPQIAKLILHHTCFSILTACYKARTRSAPDYNHKPVGRVPVLRPFEPYWENPGSDPRYSTTKQGFCIYMYLHHTCTTGGSTSLHFKADVKIKIFIIIFNFRVLGRGAEYSQLFKVAAEVCVIVH